MDTGLVKVDAKALGDDLASQGHAAVYGIYFDTAKAIVKPESDAQLQQVAQLLQSRPELQLLVVGHTDNVGGLASNMQLSRARAEAVVQALTSRYGVAPPRLSAQLTFHDSYDGGALGNVDLSILPSANHHLTSTSIPLLWNTQVSQAGTRYDANALGLPAAASGCGNFTGSSALPFGSALAASGVIGGIPQPGGLPGYPFIDPSVSTTTPSGFLPVTPGVDSIDGVTAGKATGDNNQVGGNPQPFPYSAQSTPGGFTQPPSPKDTVIRYWPKKSKRYLGTGGAAQP